MKITVVKSLVSLGMGLLLQAPVFAQANGFRCENNMYRESVVEKTEYMLSVSDTFFRGGHSELNQLIQKQIKLNTVSVQQLRLIIDEPDDICTSTNKFSITCKGSAKGALHVDAYSYGGPLQSVKLSFEVSVKNLDLEMRLAADGNKLGNKNIVGAHATGTIIVGDTEIPLEWDSFYYATQENHGSTCHEY